MVSKCCFCVDLKMGAAILGWLCIVGAILSLIAGIAALRYLFVKTNLSSSELSNLHSAQL